MKENRKKKQRKKIGKEGRKIKNEWTIENRKRRKENKKKERGRKEERKKEG